MVGSGRVWAHLAGFRALPFSPGKGGAQESVQQGLRLQVGGGWGVVRGRSELQSASSYLSEK